MVADTGDMVVRSGTSSTRILLHRAGFAGIVPIASSVDFSDTGLMPGINDAGNAIAFYGVKSGRPGIFVARRKADGTWENPVRVAGRSTDAGPGPFSGFSEHTRVGVSNSGQIVFIANYSSGQAAIYSVFVDLDFVGPLADDKRDEWWLGAVPIAQAGDTLSGTSAAIQTFSLYDPVNDDGSVVFHSTLTDGTECIVKAEVPVRVKVIRTDIRRDHWNDLRPYRGVVYSGHATQMKGNLELLINGTRQEFVNGISSTDCWEMQDVLPAGLYSGARIAPIHPNDQPPVGETACKSEDPFSSTTSLVTTMGTILGRRKEEGTNPPKPPGVLRASATTTASMFPSSSVRFAVLVTQRASW
ncbi:MAG: hypothetical protein HYX78_05705 [Armatimonadetes bacterium]|nr:hypothetical protein [Armatimonadota bacterium]